MVTEHSFAEFDCPRGARVEEESGVTKAPRSDDDEDGMLYGDKLNSLVPNTCSYGFIKELVLRNICTIMFKQVKSSSIRNCYYI